MSSFMESPLDQLRRKATRLILAVMALGGVLVTILHWLNPTTHPISLVIPPLTVIFCSCLLFYLIRYPKYSQQITKTLLVWSCLIIALPEYFFIAEALIDPQKRLVESLPPISSGIFLLSTSVIMFLNPQKFIKFASLFWLAIGAPIVIYLIFHRQELETPRGLELMVTLLPAMGINVALILFNSQLQDAIRQREREIFYLKEVSERDALTGVFNRRAGEQILQSLIERGGQDIGIILCDIDHFKRVNDMHGHLVGDRVLQAVAQCIQAHLRKKDVLVRWGGEEFLVVVIGEGAQELTHLAERLRAKVASQPNAPVGTVTVSLGVTLLQPPENLTQLFERADQALYRAKELGRNQTIYG
jgi:diguanylate cyclase (GGDEF)-like protein